MKNLLTNILSGRRWGVVGAVLVATFLLVVSAWGATPGAAKKGVPKGGCTISGVAHTAAYCSGYDDGAFAGLKAEAARAFLVGRPSGKISLYVRSTFTDHDSVGEDFVYALRSDIAASPLYTLAPSAASANFVIHVVTLTGGHGRYTDGSAVIVTGGSGADTGNVKGIYVSTVVFDYGIDWVRRGAQGVLSSIDRAISALPAA